MQQHSENKIKVLLYGGFGKTGASLTMCQVANQVYRIEMPNATSIHTLPTQLLQNLRNLRNFAHFSVDNILEIFQQIETQVATKQLDGVIIDSLEDIIHLLPKDWKSVLLRLGCLDAHLCLIARHVPMRVDAVSLSPMNSVSPFPRKMRELLDFIDLFIQMDAENRDKPPQRGTVTGGKRMERFPNSPIEVNFQHLHKVLA